MLTANNENNEKKIAWDSQKNEEPFYCPECNSKVLLKKGKVRVHHFSHLPPVNCQFGKGESELHYKVKKSIYEYLKKNCNTKKCELERSLNGVRPDISLYINNFAVAIEIQKSTIDIREIYRRMKCYDNLGIYVIWVIPNAEPTKIFRKVEEVYVHKIKTWEKYLHALYFGRLYYWQCEDIVKAYHFDSFQSYKEETNWFNECGEEESAGGYYTYTKTLKTILPLDNDLRISEDFINIYKEKEFKTMNFETPKCKIWIDKHKKWW